MEEFFPARQVEEYHPFSHMEVGKSWVGFPLERVFLLERKLSAKVLLNPDTIRLLGKAGI